MIHTVKGFSIVNEAEVDGFLEFSCSFYDTTDVGSLISGTFAFSKSSLNVWKFLDHILLKPGLENFQHYFASIWNECNCLVVWTFFGIPFFGFGMKTDLFQSCGHCWVFQICWHIECCTLTALSGSYYEVVIGWRRWSEASTLFCLWGRFELLSSNLNPWGNCVFLGMEYMPQAVSPLWQWLWVSCLFSSLSSGMFVCSVCVCVRERDREAQITHLEKSTHKTNRIQQKFLRIT